MRTMPFPLTTWLVHPEVAACDAFGRRFAGLADVRVVRGRFEDLGPHDAFVTAGNAFGIMTAGIDAAVVREFGPRLMRRVQDRILDDYLGEQPVGTAFVLPTAADEAGARGRCRYLVHAPTMRVPGSIAGTDKVYAATWAALLAVYRHNAGCRRDGRTGEAIGTVAFPAMGTGFGGVAFDEAARQMAAAWTHYRNPPHRLDWDTAVDRHKAISYDGDRQVAR